MRSPTAALLWEIWRRHRGPILAIVVITLVSWLADLAEGRHAPGDGEPTLRNQLLGMLSFLVLFGTFGYTEGRNGRSLGGFPRRLFTLPVSSLRLVAVPVVAGICSVELLYLLWMDRLFGGGATSPLLTGVLLAAFMVLYQAGLWTLERLGPLRLVVLGVVGMALLTVGMVPSYSVGRPSLWRSEAVLSGLVAAPTVAAFLFAWSHVARLRSGGGRGRRRLGPLVGRFADLLPRRRTAFASPEAAQFWFDWRCSGVLLPLLVGGVLLVVVAPLAWLARHDPGDAVRVVLISLATPIALAIPVGMAFSKPTPWSDDMTLPAFVAVRPLSAHQMVAVRARVAALATAISWFLVLPFLGGVLWSANLDTLSRLAIEWWAIHDHSVVAVYQIAALLAIAGMFLTWRFLVAGLWIGLSGSRWLFNVSAGLLVLAAIACVAFRVDRLPGWMLEDPERMVPFLWTAALAVAAKYALAARAWRGGAPRLARPYLWVWFTGTACFVALGVTLWGAMRMYLPVDAHRLRSLLILLALLAVPLGRLGLAPSSLEGNRHHP